LLAEMENRNRRLWLTSYAGKLNAAVLKLKLESSLMLQFRGTSNAHATSTTGAGRANNGLRKPTARSSGRLSHASSVGFWGIFWRVRIRVRICVSSATAARNLRLSDFRGLNAAHPFVYHKRGSQL
jgi:hypothetical protein